MIGIIYMFTNKVNGKKYIGKTINPAERYRNHKYANEDSVFHRAIKKYGFENFEYEILESHFYNSKDESNDQLNELEKFYIKKYESNIDINGYNISEGGEGTSGHHRKWETRLKISESKKGNNNPMKKSENRKKVSETLKSKNYSRPMSEENKIKASERMRGKGNPMYGHYGELNPSYGVDWTKNISKKKYQEFCEHRSESSKGEKNPMYGKKQKKSLWRLPDGSTKIMANCSVAAQHKDWIKIKEIDEPNPED